MRPTRWPGRLAPLTLGLALWMSLPGVQWCSYTWEQCRSAWAGEPTEQAPCAGAGMCAVADPGTCAGSCETEALPASDASAGPVGCPLADEAPPGLHGRAAGESQSDPPSPGERAWCVGVVADGIVTRSLAVMLPAAPSHPAVVAEPPPPIIAPAQRPSALPAAPCPGIAAAHAPPLSRAPPARA